MVRDRLPNFFKRHSFFSFLQSTPASVQASVCFVRDKRLVVLFRLFLLFFLLLHLQCTLVPFRIGVVLGREAGVVLPLLAVSCLWRAWVVVLPCYASIRPWPLLAGALSVGAVPMVGGVRRGRAPRLLSTTGVQCQMAPHLFLHRNTSKIKAIGFVNPACFRLIPNWWLQAILLVCHSAVQVDSHCWLSC